MMPLWDPSLTINPISDGVWCQHHTLQLLKHYYSKMIHPTHTIIPYIWSHEYPLRLEPKFFFKISIVLELHNLWRSERKQPIKNRVKSEWWKTMMFSKKLLYFQTNDIAQNNDSLKKITFSFSIFHFISFLKQWYGSLKNWRKLYWKGDKLGEKSRFFS